MQIKSFISQLTHKFGQNSHLPLTLNVKNRLTNIAVI